MFQRYRNFGCLCAVLYLFSTVNAWPSFAEPTVLQGNATHWQQIDESQPESKTTSTTTLQSGLAQEELPPMKPEWMAGTVYSEKSYVLRTFYETRIFFKVGKTTPWAPPAHKNTRMFLKKPVLDHWRGYKPFGTVWITCMPYGPPGNFYFASDSRRGPRGYLERIGNDQEGFPTFRYWFIDSDSNQQ